MWPKPRRTCLVGKVIIRHVGSIRLKRYLVGSGLYLEGAAKKELSSAIAAKDVIALVKDAAALLEKEGDAAFPNSAASRASGSRARHISLSMTRRQQGLSRH